MSKNNIEARKAYVADVVETINNSASAVLVDYRGINVEQDTAMRKALREAGVTYRVIKNSALSRAFEQTGTTGYDEYFQGPPAASLPSMRAKRPSASSAASSTVKSTTRTASKRSPASPKNPCSSHSFWECSPTPSVRSRSLSARSRKSRARDTRRLTELTVKQLRTTRRAAA